MAFVLTAPDPEPFCEIQIDGPEGRRALVAIREHAARLTVDARVHNGRGEGEAWRIAESMHIELSLMAPASCVRDGSWRAWDLLSGKANDLGPFRDLAWWIPHHLFEPSSLEPDLDPRVGHVERSVLDLCDLATRCAVAACDPEARRVALQFHPATRFLVYAAIVNDPSGRARQLADVCPAIFTYCSYFGPEDQRTIGVLDMVVRGARLRDLLDAVAPRRTLDARVILRRAPPDAEVAALESVVRAPGSDPNDIPMQDEKRVRWYRTMARWGAVAASAGPMAVQIGGFFSRHAGSEIGIGVEEVIDWVTHGGTAPRRQSSPQAVRRSIDRWHRDLHDTADMDRSIAFPPPPKSAWASTTLEVRAILTVGELQDEGRAMRSCVAAFMSHAMSGALVFFRGVVAGRRCTICVQNSAAWCGLAKPSESRWTLREASGYANAPLDVAELRAIDRWVRGLE